MGVLDRDLLLLFNNILYYFTIVGGETVEDGSGVGWQMSALPWSVDRRLWTRKDRRPKSRTGAK